VAFTYDLTESGDALAWSKIRLLIPDNDSTDYELEDAEVDYFYDAAGGNITAAAIACCKWLARKYAKIASFTADGLTFHGSERAKIYAERAAELAAAVDGGLAIATLERADKYAEEAEDTEYGTGVIYVRT